MSVLSAVCIGSLMMVVIYWWRNLTGVTPYPWLKITIMIGALIAAALVGTELTFFVLNILIVLVTGIPMYVGEEWKSTLNNRILQQQYRMLQLEQQQTVFELALLRAKISPHFLYNMHNTIAGLISKDPKRAEELVLLLSKFFRFTLNKDSDTFHTLKDDLEIVTVYLQMQQIRFEHRMRYEVVVSPELMGVKIPSFILQPIVENAVKHGVENSTTGGLINIRVERDGENLTIRVSDPGGPFPEVPGMGYGLQMVMNKLRLLYGEGFTIEWNNAHQKYVSISFPVQHPDFIDR
jgi:LytS/YehU family sensor histidine kinase